MFVLHTCSDASLISQLPCLITQECSFFCQHFSSRTRSLSSISIFFIIIFWDTVLPVWKNSLLTAPLKKLKSSLTALLKELNPLLTAPLKGLNSLLTALLKGLDSLLTAPPGVDVSLWESVESQPCLTLLTAKSYTAVRSFPLHSSRKKME